VADEPPAEIGGRRPLGSYRYRLNTSIEECGVGHAVGEFVQITRTAPLTVCAARVIDHVVKLDRDLDPM
jgi:hypothetical protein